VSAIIPVNAGPHRAAKPGHGELRVHPHANLARRWAADEWIPAFAGTAFATGATKLLIHWHCGDPVRHFSVT
jgi:hypothetical protein